MTREQIFDVFVVAASQFYIPFKDFLTIVTLIYMFYGQAVNERTQSQPNFE